MHLRIVQICCKKKIWDRHQNKQQVLFEIENGGLIDVQEGSSINN